MKNKKVVWSREPFDDTKSTHTSTQERCFHCDEVIVKRSILPALCKLCAGAFMKSNGAKSANSTRRSTAEVGTPMLKTLTYDQLPDGQYILINQEDEVVARIEGIGPETFKYAAFIVKACNHFDALRQTLKDVMAHSELQAGELRERAVKLLEETNDR